jgi:acyl-CoA thioesterase
MGLFAAGTVANALGRGRYSGRIEDGWDIRGNTNGGLLLALAARAMLAETGRPDPVTVTAHFLSPGRPGPAETEVRVLKQGRRFSTASATLGAAGKPLLAVLGTFGELAQDAALHMGSAPPELPPPAECFHQHPDNGAPGMFGQVELRLHPDDAGFAHGTPSGEPRVRGWVRLLGDEPIDSLALLFVADAYPPAVFNSNVPLLWVPTVELTVHVRARPVAGWLRSCFTTRFVSGGFLEEDGEIWDASGRLVAQSRQLALLPQLPAS